MKQTVLVLAVVFSLGLLFYGNLSFVKNNPGGNDFLPRWVGTRLFLTEGQNPYSRETTLAIQNAIYGRMAQPGEDEALFVYPFYAMIFFAPFGLIRDYELARAAWITFQEICVVLTVIVALRFGEWTLSPLALGMLSLFGLTWYHGARPLVDGNAAILMTLLVSIGILFLSRSADFSAGILFGLATIKPQMVLLLIGLAIVWTISLRRYGFVIGFLCTMAFLVGVSLLMSPTWIIENLEQILAYQGYLPPMTPATIGELWLGNVGKWLGLAMNGFVAAILINEWWRVRGKQYVKFLWLACFTLAASSLAGVLSTSSNYAILLPVLILVWASWRKRMGARANKLILAQGTLVLIGLWAVFTATLSSGPQFRESEVMFFLMPVFLVSNLYMLRPCANPTETRGLANG